jgi:hypothetical protein
MRPKYCQGPWRRSASGTYIEKPGYGLICEMFGVSLDAYRPDGRPNAFLIAGAPTMYEALEKIFEMRPEKFDAENLAKIIGEMRDIAEKALIAAREEK